MWRDVSCWGGWIDGDTEAAVIDEFVLSGEFADDEAAGRGL